MIDISHILETFAGITKSLTYQTSHYGHLGAVLQKR